MQIYFSTHHHHLSPHLLPPQSCMLTNAVSVGYMPLQVPL